MPETDEERLARIEGTTEGLWLNADVSWLISKVRGQSPPKEEPYYTHGRLNWGYPVDVGHLILQLQALDPTMKVSSVMHIETTKGTRARAYGLSMSYERWDESGWLDFKLPVPKCLAIWAYANPAPSLPPGLTAGELEEIADDIAPLDFDANKNVRYKHRATLQGWAEWLRAQSARKPEDVG